MIETHRLTRMRKRERGEREATIERIIDKINDGFFCISCALPGAEMGGHLPPTVSCFCTAEEVRHFG